MRNRRSEPLRDGITVGGAEAPTAWRFESSIALSGLPPLPQIGLGILLWLASSFALAAPLQPFTATYDVLRNGTLAGEARVSLIKLDERRWEWTTRTRGTRGLAALANLEVDERTVFRWRRGRPELVESTYDQTALVTSRHRSLRVDRPSKTIASFDGKRLHTLAYAPYTIDVHLATIALMTSLAAATPLEYTVATRDEIETYRYRQLGNETLPLSHGNVETVRVQRVREQTDRSDESWHAPSRAWVPVRIKHDDGKGERIELRLRHVVVSKKT